MQKFNFFPILLILLLQSAIQLGSAEPDEFQSYNKAIDDAIGQLASLDLFAQKGIIGLDGLKRANCSLVPVDKLLPFAYTQAQCKLLGITCKPQYRCTVQADEGWLDQGVRFPVKIKLSIVAQLDENSAIEKIWFENPDFIFRGEVQEGMFGFWSKLWSKVKDFGKAIFAKVLANGLHFTIKTN